MIARLGMRTRRDKCSIFSTPLFTRRRLSFMLRYANTSLPGPLYMTLLCSLTGSPWFVLLIECDSARIHVIIQFQQTVCHASAWYADTHSWDSSGEYANPPSANMGRPAARMMFLPVIGLEFPDISDNTDGRSKVK